MSSEKIIPYRDVVLIVMRRFLAKKAKEYGASPEEQKIIIEEGMSYYSNSELWSVGELVQEYLYGKKNML